MGETRNGCRNMMDRSLAKSITVLEEHITPLKPKLA
jgi:hypothetical protein